MTLPRATMRLQFHKGFTFADAAALVPYLAGLGISHVYASPIMTARPGSPHGYDVVDPNRINPELGGEQEFERLVRALRRHQMGIVLDIVPNHMAIGAGNAWWMDVLAAGRKSRYADFFDIDWEPADASLRGKILLPVLGRPYGEALAAGEISVRTEHGKACIRYFDHVFPLSDAAAHAVQQAPPETFAPSAASGRDRLHALLEAQHYRLAWWRLANDAINWRRFFDINDLVAMRIEDDAVFEAVHENALRLYARGLIDGLRIDHIDGLAEPEAYCRKLRERLASLYSERPADAREGRAYLIVEKILSRHEELPGDWQTDGTTGYDFMDAVNALQHDAAGERPLSTFWRRISGRSANFDDEEELARRQILDRSFSAQRESTVRALYAALQSDLALRDISWPAIRRALTEILAHFPIYRVYSRVGRASQADREFLGEAVAKAAQTCLPSDRWLVEMLGAWLGETPMYAGSATKQNMALAKFQQLSAPLCAKAVEDTAFYRYGRLLSRNDVGFDIRRFATSPAEFHDTMAKRVARLPHSLLATATHDHKRGEDVRSRLAVLSELADDWTKAAQSWVDLARQRCATRDGVAARWGGDLAMLFQTVVGAWPMTLQVEDRPALSAFAKRIAAWQQKALREAKLDSDWSAPDDAYERTLADLIGWLFAEPNALLRGLHGFACRIMAAGAANGLGQILLKLTAPGIPDTYQGTEYWDLSLVDPDNRSPVDFAARQRSLDTSLEECCAHWRDGRIKQQLIARVLALRKEIPDTFANGKYVPLAASGPAADHVIAFARMNKKGHAIAVIGRQLATALQHDSIEIAPSFWQRTKLLIPPELQITFRSVLASSQPAVLSEEIEIGNILHPLPVALLTSDAK